MHIPLAFEALDQFLYLLLISVSMELTVVGITMAVNWRLSSEYFIIEYAWVVVTQTNVVNLQIGVQVFHHFHGHRYVGLTDWCHL